MEITDKKLRILVIVLFIIIFLLIGILLFIPAPESRPEQLSLLEICFD